ncbi:MAG: hypothetical protein JNM76_13340 [Betaproteobacteria bacterium]|nr:hypothetical protein [Betaproteobacteria bacterium]
MITRHDSEDDAEDLHRMLAATLHLMTSYAHAAAESNACPLLADVIARHLAEIARSVNGHRILRATSADLAGRWKLKADVPTFCPRRPWWVRVVDA